MSKVNLFCPDVNTHGGKLVLPFVGEVSVSKNGIVEVDEEVADFMVQNGGAGYEIVDEEVEKEIKKEKKKEADKTSDKASTSKKKEEKPEEDSKETKKQLEALELADLIQMAEGAEIPAENYEKFKTNKKLMVNFLMKNLK